MSLKQLRDILLELNIHHSPGDVYSENEVSRTGVDGHGNLRSEVGCEKERVEDSFTIIHSQGLGSPDTEESCVVVYTRNSGFQEALTETGGRQAGGQPGLCGETKQNKIQRYQK